MPFKQNPKKEVEIIEMRAKWLVVIFFKNFLGDFYYPPSECVWVEGDRKNGYDKTPPLLSLQSFLIPRAIIGSQIQMNQPDLSRKPIGMALAPRIELVVILLRPRSL